jgi:hypothetical protein
MPKNGNSRIDINKSKRIATILILIGASGLILTLTMFLIGGSYAEYFFSVGFWLPRGPGQLVGLALTIIPFSLVCLGLGVYQLTNINKKIL